MQLTRTILAMVAVLAVSCRHSAHPQIGTTLQRARPDWHCTRASPATISHTRRITWPCGHCATSRQGVLS